MNDRWLGLLVVFAVVLAIAITAMQVEKLTATDSLLQPMAITFRDTSVNYFFSWPVYVVLAAILGVLYWRRGRL